MRLTLWTGYALRTLIFVGAKRGSLATIAESFDISKTHLMKVVNRLGQQGYLDTVRSKGGGLRMARSPAEIRVGAIRARDGRRSRRDGMPRRAGVLPD
jgi:Rrf2 family transcriptional regulator, nitric oxide-sensitive transcriptional repressor